MNHPKPKLVISACFKGEFVRYDGGTVRDPFVEKLLNYCQPIRRMPRGFHRFGSAQGKGFDLLEGWLSKALSTLHPKGTNGRDGEVLRGISQWPTGGGWLSAKG
jgi:hypothetical protein